MTVSTPKDYKGRQPVTSTVGRVEALEARTSSAPVSKTATYTMTATDSIVLANGTFTVTLPTVASAPSGRRYTVKNTGSGTITVAPATGTVDALASVTIAAGVAVDFVHNGANWFRV